MKHPGFLLVIEGVDGAGKSTLARRLATECSARGMTCRLSHEPTRGQFGQALRESAKSGRLPLEAELELFLKDRAEHVAQVIAPALAAGEIVILDRYYLSTAAYQGARGADPAEILVQNEAFAPAPDLVLLLDLDPTSGVQRIQHRGDQPDDFEELAYQREVRRIFLSLDRPFIHVLDAGEPADAIFAASLDLLLPALARAQLSLA